jgi:hypothetical protein
MNNPIKLFDFYWNSCIFKILGFVLLLLGPNIFVSILIAVLIHELAHAYVAK